MNRAARRAMQANGRRSARAALASGQWGEWESRPRPDPAQWPALRGVVACYVNALYSVQVRPHVTEWGEVVQLMVRRHDGAPVRAWTDMQRIKDDLTGPNRTAVEVYPARSDLVDSANMYHLWVLPVGFALPFTLKTC